MALLSSGRGDSDKSSFNADAVRDERLGLVPPFALAAVFFHAGAEDEVEGDVERAEPGRNTGLLLSVCMGPGSAV